MDSHCFDVVVVGAGISGLTAVSAAARSNQRVALVATGPGSFVHGSGCLKAQEFLRSRASYQMDEAIAYFQEMAQAACAPLEGNISEARYLPTILGDFQSLALAPRPLWNAEPRNGAATVIVGIRELSCFDENFMAERLKEQARRLGVACTYTARQLSLAHAFGGSVTTVRIANRFDNDPGFRSAFVNELGLVASGYERILVPGILGLHSSAHQFAHFECEPGCSLSELPTLPPSVSGLRLFNRLWSYLREIGVELFQGFPVQKMQIQKGSCSELQIASPGHPLILRGESVVLAAGRDSARLLGTAFAGIDERMRPLNAAGSVMARNIFVAESGPNYRVKGDGDAMEIYAGYRAGNLATATRGGQYAAG